MTPAISEPRPAPSERRARARFDPGLLVGTTDEEVLRCYLTLVQTWRGGGEVSAMRLRQADLAVLVAILGTDRDEIERRLVAVTDCSPAAASLGRRLLMASVGAIVIGLLAAPVAATSPSALAPDPVDAGLAVSARSAIRAGALHPFDVLDHRAGLPRAPAAEAAPVPPAATTETRPEPAPTLTAPERPAGTVATVAIDSLGIELPVVAGGQSVIDQGVAAHYTAPGWEPPVPPGSPGTYWLAAHRSTHGAPFAALPDIAIGAEVRVTTSSATFVYSVTSVEVVGLWPGDDAIYGTDPTASTILLQTCIDATLRVLVRGTLTASS